MFVGVIAEVAMMDLAVRATPKGCEALGFSLMMSVRNFALTANDILGSWLIDSRHWEFKKLVRRERRHHGARSGADPAASADSHESPGG